MAKTLGLGTTLLVEGTTPGTYTAIGGLTNVPAPSIEKGDTEVTDLDSVAREYLGTLPDNGEIAFSGFADADNAGQTLLRQDAVSSDAPVRDWQIYFERQGITCEFSGFLRQYTAFSADGPDEPLTMEGAIRITGSITFTEDS